MKNLLLIFVALLFYGNVNGQSKTAPLYFNTALGDMKAYPGTDKLQASATGLSTMNDDNGGVYRWDANSTATDDGFIDISVPGVATGRWHRVGNGNTIKFTVSFNSNLIGNSTYTHTFATPLPFVPSNIFIQAATINAVRNAVPRASISKTGFQVVFEQLIGLGQTVSFDALIIKQ